MRRFPVPALAALALAASLPLASPAAPEGSAAAAASTAAWAAHAPEGVLAGSIPQIVAALEAGETTSEALVRGYLARIEAIDRSGPTLRSVLAVNPAALEQARASDARRAAGKALGRLDGVPILLKDNIESADPLATTAGALALAGNVTGRDAPLVAGLRAQGAVVLGKTNLSQWANFRSEGSISGWSALGGQVRNPHILDRSPCGSSSGSGAAVAASLAAGAVGTETNGSIICPATVNGVVGFKPTVGLVSQRHIVPISSSQDTAGPMTRTVAGAALLLDAMATGEARTGYAAALDAGSLAGARIGVARFAEGSNPHIVERFDRALDDLRAAGAVLVEIDEHETPDGFWGDARTVLNYEFKATLDEYLAEAAPAVKTRDLAAVIAFNEAHADVELALFGQDIFETSAELGGLDSEDYRKAVAAVQKATRAEGIDALLAEHDLVALVSPSGPLAPPVDAINGDVWPDWAGAGWMAAIAGYPHLTVPMGTVKGLPIGLSFLGAKDDDARILSLGHAYEERTNRRVEPGYLPTAEARPEIGRAMAGRPGGPVAGPSAAQPAAAAHPGDAAPRSGWQRPADDILAVLHAPELPWVWTAPGGEHLLLADPVAYPPLAELAAPMHKLAGIRVNPRLNAVHGRHGGTSPRLMAVDGGETTELALPAGAEVHAVDWSVDGRRFALSVAHDDHLGLWVGSVDGKVRKIDGVTLNPLLTDEVKWLPDQERLLVARIPARGAPPAPPAIPAGPKIVEGEGASARSTYEARNLLETAYDEALFDYYATSQLAIVDPAQGTVRALGEPAPYVQAEFSPDGRYLLVERLVGPWSREVAWWRFAREIEVWDERGEPVAKVASLPLSDSVPVHGVPEGPRSVSWRPTAPHSLFWIEALDGGDPVAEVPHRDRLMRLQAPFAGEPQEVFRAEHRIQPWDSHWAADGGTLMLTQRDRMRRWRSVWLLDVDGGTSRPWFDLDEDDRYNDPGSPLLRPLPHGGTVMHQEGDAVYFRGSGATDTGDRPFLDLRPLGEGEPRRLFRSPADRYEMVLDVVGDDRLLIRSESATDVPNYYVAKLGERVDAARGEATRRVARVPITRFEDPAPRLREIEKRIVRYEREDGVPLSFILHLPPGYEEGERLPTVVYAYPLEYSGAATAGQVRGSEQRFSRIWGPSHLYFLLNGYAVLDQTAMPMIGDPETTYDTFVPQLVADAEAAVAKAIEIGVADPDRIGVIGHSHGGLMVANLLAHSDLFRAGIARSGSYNKTNQPFGFQSERRSLFEALDAYIALSPTFFAHQVDEPVLIIHGDDDSNPGTLTYQSEVFYEAVRGAGGTARLVLLPYEDHGYRARESVEHVLWEQLRWFDEYVKGAGARE